MTKQRKAVLIVSTILAILTIIGVASYLVLKDFNNYNNGEKIKDENALIIGTYTKTKSSEGMEYANRIYIDIYNNGEKVESLNYLTTSKEVINIDDMPNMSFVDLKSVMAKYTDNLGIRFWHLNKPTKNYIQVSTEWTCAPYLSGKVTLSDSGLYAVNIPTENGITPQVEHSYVYQRNIFGW